MKKTEIGALILRIFLGLSFFIHGLSKFQNGIDNTAGWFESIGIPGFMGYVVAIIELIGGLLLIIGLGTRYIAALFVLIMIGAIVKVKIAAGFMGNGQGAGYELELAFAVMAAFLFLNSNATLSLDSKLFSKEQLKKVNS
ncbi:putative membrane protein YphA (DoxX/SURF4 family) [Neobacillus bataviensis]|uniref:Putative membrane protein YphA (DoxX/SURF4 family) n=1 Tax=Neobacillus bataviensis TaxID=220685 RepID=A0A561C6Z0_9BACI|nr:DoxX family protein [Neobacillus bataviensis]TWD86834.1 putative membrane protein YphA (DoxX/SURF4 family) [Neobacillus bataviensis]